MSQKVSLKKILKRVFISLLIVVGLMLIGVAIVLNTVVTPKRVTPIILDLAQHHVKGKVDCESVDITFFSTFPNLGVQLKHGSISSERDTLVAFDNVVVSINPVAFLRDNKLIIRKLLVEEADIYAFVDTAGVANWDILISDDETEETTDTTRQELPELNIDNIRLKNVNLIYDNLQDDMLVMADSVNAFLKGKLSKAQANLKLGISTSGLTFYTEGETLINRLPISFHTELDRDRVEKTLAMNKGKLKVSTLEIAANGVLTNKATMDTPEIEVELALNASSLDDLLKMIPAGMTDLSAKFIAGGQIQSNVKMQGKIGHGHIPPITLSFELADGSLAAPKYAKKPFLEDLDVSLSAFVDLTGTEPSTLSLHKLYLQTADSKITAEAELNNLLANPTIHAIAKGDVNFTNMSKKLPMLAGIQMEGAINFDVGLGCLLSDITTMNLGKINANGYVEVNNVAVDYPAEQLLLYASKAEMRLGSNLQDSVRGEVRETLLRGKLSLDTLNLQWNNQLKAEASRLSVLVNTSEPKDSNAIVPVMVGGRIRKVHLEMGDSVRLRGVTLTGSLRSYPQKAHPELPELTVKMSIDSILGRAYEVGGRLSKSNLDVTLTKIPDRSKSWMQPQVNPQLRDSTGKRIPFVGGGERRPMMRDTTLTRAQLDSLRQLSIDPTTNLSFQLESEETKKLIRQWEAKGTWLAHDASVRTPYFPVPIRMREAEMSFTSDEVKVKNIHMLLGESDFKLRGALRGVKQALLRNGKIETHMDLTADSLDLNELIRAAVKGTEYANRSLEEKDSIAVLVLDEGVELAEITADTTDVGVFVIPRNLNVELDARVNNAKFADVLIHSANGKIILREQAVKLSDLSIDSNIGSSTATVVYKAPNLQGAHLGLELHTKKIDIKELIEVMPYFDEITPMLSSFEGVVDCDMTMVTELDSLMNVIMPETTASFLVSGQKLVLLDGETFAEIAKTLKFKNKNRNVIDSLSVEMILDDEKLMIFPFQLTMDRYKAAVGGVQNLDMTFDYHITVLKSPIPFKLGLNISGSMENMKIRLGKAKYKNLFTASSEKKVEETINLRTEMDERLRKSIEEIVGMDFSKSVRRPRVEMSDSLRRELFQLVDTVATSPFEVEADEHVEVTDSI